MNPLLLELLACPDCKGDLKLEIDSGTTDYIDQGKLNCGCGKIFEIRDDIPFFSSVIQHSGVKNQQETYSTWWDDYHDESTITNPDNRNFFFNSLRIPASKFEDSVVLDAGCGNGRFSYLVSHYRPRLLVSFDISTGLHHARRAIQKHNPQAHVVYVQGDMTKPPFRPKVFDLLFSWGVIHHTPSAPKTFSTLSKLAKQGGQFGVYVYEFHPLYRFGGQPLSLLAYLRSLFLIRPVRFLCSRLPADVVQMLFAPIYYLERFFNFGVMGCHGPDQNRWDRDSYRRVVIDRFKTRYASEHQLEEVIGWFQQNGFDHLRVGSSPKVSVSGVKVGDGPSPSIDLKIGYETEEDLSMAHYLKT